MTASAPEQKHSLFQARTDREQALQRYSMRRWWLARYSHEQLRELGAGLAHLDRHAA